MDQPPAPCTTDLREAATVILVRKSRRAPFEVFLMRRHRKQSFMGGAFVFPGGARDPEDTSHALHHFSQDDPPHFSVDRLKKAGLTDEKACSLIYTAIRETFEESGVLFAQEKFQKIPSENKVPDSLRLARLRYRLQREKLSLSLLVQEEKLVFTPASLMPYARWITPDIERKRFDTWFFIAESPPNQTPVHDDVELVESLWVTPQEALAKNGAKEMLLMPPTLKTLEELRVFPSIAALFAATAQKEIPPILPQAISTEIRFGVKLPHDPEYTLAGFKQAYRPEEPSRIMMIDGKWTAVFAGEK